MTEQLTGRRRLGHSFALIYHRKRLIGKDFVDCTRDTEGFARLSVGGAESYPIR